MKKLYTFLAFTLLLSAPLVSAEEFKKIYDNVKERVVEICSVDADGTMNVAQRCHYDWMDIPFISYATDPKIKRKPSELTEIVTPVHTRRDKNSVYGVFQNTLVEQRFGMANNTSEIIVYQASEESKNKYAYNTIWLINNDDFSKEVDSVPGYKKEDIFCLKKSPEGYRDNLAVKIKRLFDKEKYAVVDTVDQGIINMGSFESHFTSLDNLVACQGKPTLDPVKEIKTSAPAIIHDLKVNDQTSAKEVSSDELVSAPDQATNVIGK